LRHRNNRREYHASRSLAEKRRRQKRPQQRCGPLPESIVGITALDDISIGGYGWISESSVAPLEKSDRTRGLTRL